MPFSKKIFDSHFESYLRRNFPEHARRIIQGRSTANLVRFFYPLLSFLIPIVFFASIALIIALFKSKILEEAQKGRFSEIITNTSIQSMIAGIFAIGIVIACISFIIGLTFGFAKARDIIFNSEELEAKMKHIWLIDQKDHPVVQTTKNQSADHEPEA